MSIFSRDLTFFLKKIQNLKMIKVVVHESWLLHLKYAHHINDESDTRIDE